MTSFGKVRDKVSDTSEQIAQLRAQVEQLMGERVTPALADAADRAESFARQASSTMRDSREAVTGRVREQPIMAVVIAAAAGYLVGRIFR